MTPAEVLLVELREATNGYTPAHMEDAIGWVRNAGPAADQFRARLSRGELAVLRLAVSLAAGELDRDLAALDPVWQERVCSSIRLTCFPELEAAEAEERF